MLANIIFSAEALMPIFLIIFLGWFLYKKGIINDNFVDVSSRLVMNVTFPLLLILKISELDIKQSFNAADIALIYAIFISVFFLGWAFSKSINISIRNQGSFVQACFRGNFGIIGLAICANLYGEKGIAIAALYLAFLIPLYNLLSIIALSGSSDVADKLSPLKFFKKIILNPLVLAIILGTLLAIAGIKIPSTFAQSANYVASISLPLALLSIGATLQFRNRGYSIKHALCACFFKIVLMPVLGTYIAILFGYRDMSLAILLVLFAMPTAVVTVPLAKSMGADGKLAGAAVVFSSAISVLTIAIGLSTLRVMNLI